jgi:hypothetical protein
VNKNGHKRSNAHEWYARKIPENDHETPSDANVQLEWSYRKLELTSRGTCPKSEEYIPLPWRMH